MGRMPWVTYVWPGLPQLWKRGSWAALGVALGVAAALDVALAGSLLWSELFPPLVRTILLVAVGLLWAGSAVYSLVWDRAGWPPQCVDPANDAYCLALDHYLKGNWLEAERVLGELIHRNARDFEAGLLLATLLRHAGRSEEAVAQLDRLDRFEGSEKWELEIAGERQLLAATRQDRPAGLTENSVPDEVPASSAA